MKADYSKGVSIAIITGIYIIAAAVGIFVFDKAVAVMPEVLALLLADVAATIITWEFGLVYENVSVYASLCGFDWLILAPIAMTALFLFISIPLMESRQLQNKPAYAEYRKNTRILI